VKSAIAQGAELFAGDLTIHGPNQTILYPHILDNVTSEMGISKEESFGPIICLYRVSSDDEAIEVANSSEISLCASIFSRTLCGLWKLQSRSGQEVCMLMGLQYILRLHYQVVELVEEVGMDGSVEWLGLKSSRNERY